MARHAQITQDNNYSISVQYIKKEVSGEVDFLHADKHESLLQIGTVILMGMVKHGGGQYLKKEVRDEADFLHVDEYQSFLQIDFNTSGLKVSYKVILSLLMIMAHYQSTQSNKFAISSQYPKKEIRNGVHHQSFYQLPLSFLMEVVRHVQSTQNRKLVIFSQYIKKKLSQLLLCSIVM